MGTEMGTIEAAREEPAGTPEIDGSAATVDTVMGKVMEGADVVVEQGVRTGISYAGENPPKTEYRQEVSERWRDMLA